MKLTFNWHLFQFILFGLIAWYFGAHIRQRHQIERENEQYYGPFIEIPTIDISPFYDNLYVSGSNDVLNETSFKLRINVSKQIDEASSQYGCFYVMNSHPQYSLSSRNEVLTHANKLFNISGKYKAEISVKNDGKIARGYIPFGKESGNVQYYENKEGFAYGYSYNENSNEYENINMKTSMDNINIWPNNIESGFDDYSQKLFTNLFNQFVDISYVLTKAYSMILFENNENVLINDFAQGGEKISLMRLFHYFSKNELKTNSDYSNGNTNNDNDNNNDNNNINNINISTVLGSSPHTDWGFLTLIMSDDVNGLQLFDKKNNKWYTIESQFNKGKILVNCGDYMSILSNGKFISPLHRVIAPSSHDKERLSFVFFFYPNYNATIPNLNDNAQSYSLFKDQSKNDENNIECQETDNNDCTKILPHKAKMKQKLSQTTFGDYISQKWKQVSRY